MSSSCNDMKPLESAPLLGPYKVVRLDQINTILQCRFYPERWFPNSAQQHLVDIPTSMLNAVPERLSEYVAGRVLARELLKRSGYSGLVGHRDSDRAPSWPNGHIGSISHSGGLAACTILPKNEFSGVGIDIEQWLPASLALQIERTVWIKDEADLFLNNGWKHEDALTITFSAKESLFKALYPQIERFFGFSAAKLCGIECGENFGRVHFRLTEQLSLEFPAGKHFIVDFKRYETHTLTGLALTKKGE